MSKPVIQCTTKVDSPCIRNCCLDENDICVGCFRHITEITGWSEMSNAQRAETIQRCNKRCEASGLKFP